MRILGLLFILLFCCCASKVECDNLRLKGQLFKSFPNNITIKANKRIQNVTIDKGTIEKTDDETYIVIPNANDSSTIRVKLKKVTKEFKFKIKKMAPSVMMFSGQTFKETDSIEAPRFRVSRPDIMVSPDLICNDFNLHITNMKVTRVTKNNIVTSELVTENRSELMRLAEFGDTYIFSDIEYKFETMSTIFNCPTAIIKIKY